MLEAGITATMLHITTPDSLHFSPAMFVCERQGESLGTRLHSALSVLVVNAN